MRLANAQLLTIVGVNSGGVQRLLQPAPTQRLSKGMRVVLPDIHTELRVGLRNASGGSHLVAVADLHDVRENEPVPRPDKKGAQEQVILLCMNACVCLLVCAHPTS